MRSCKQYTVLYNTCYMCMYVSLLSIPMSWIWQVFHWQVFKKWHCRPLRLQNSNKQLCRMPVSIHFTLSLLLAPSLSLSLSPPTLKTTDLLASACANLDTCTPIWHIRTIICTAYTWICLIVWYSWHFKPCLCGHAPSFCPLSGHLLDLFHAALACQRKSWHDQVLKDVEGSR